MAHTLYTHTISYIRHKQHTLTTHTLRLLLRSDPMPPSLPRRCCTNHYRRCIGTQLSPTPAQMHLQPTGTGRYLLTLILWSPAFGETDAHTVDVYWTGLCTAANATADDAATAATVIGHVRGPGFHLGRSSRFAWQLD